MGWEEEGSRGRLLKVLFKFHSTTFSNPLTCIASLQLLFLLESAYRWTSTSRDIQPRWSVRGVRPTQQTR